MKAKHTPGPWSLIQGNDIAKADGEKIACALGFFDEDKKYTWTDETKANARLIAAAPELLAALEEIVKNDPFLQSASGIVANQAIVKATGGDA